MISSKPEISIVVPVYNAERTLSRCIESIITQSFLNWELLLIDDGSSDNSLLLCQKASLNNDKIHVLSQSHQGVAAARNLAFEKAQGNYVCFVDSDDTIEPDYLEILYQYHDYDMVICGYFVDTYENSGKLIKKERHIPINFQSSSLNNRTSLIPLFMSGMININCNKLLHLDIINNNKIRYKPIPINEDYLFMIDYLSNSKSIATVEKPLYHWIHVKGNKTGVDSMPNNLLDIYNLAQKKTREYFDDMKAGDITQYYSYCLVIQKYFRSYHEGLLTKKELLNLLSVFHKNQWVKASFNEYSPKSKGEWIMHLLLKHGFFFIHHYIQNFLSVIS